MRLRIRSSLTLTVTSGFEVLGRLPHLPTYHAATNTRRRPATPEKSVKRSPTVGKEGRKREGTGAGAGRRSMGSLSLPSKVTWLARTLACPKRSTNDDGIERDPGRTHHGSRITMAGGN